MLYIFGTIGIDWDADRLHAAISDHLAATPTEPLHVVVSSFGGDINEALKMRTMLKTSEVVTIGHVCGFNASAATILATGFDFLYIAPAALQLIHPSSAVLLARLTAENAAALKAEIDAQRLDLANIDALISNLYAARSGGKTTAAQFSELMQQERWLTPAECERIGLVDGIDNEDFTKELTALQAADAAAPAKNEEPASEQEQEEQPAGEPAAAISPAVLNDRAELKALKQEVAALRAQLDAAPATDTDATPALTPEALTTTPSVTARSFYAAVRTML